jgi:diacylglycerol kinase (ATP)
VIVVANAGAGGASGLDDALRVLGDVEVCRTSTPDELDEIVGRDDFLVVAGGDGSLHAVVAALARRNALGTTTVGLIPLGTGNDFARGAGIPLDPAEAARLVLAGTPSMVDLLVDDDGGVVVNNVHTGAGAEASRAATRFKRLGRLGYSLGAAVAALNPPTLRLKVTVDSEMLSDRRTLQVAIGNAPYVGGGTPLTPTADPTDGKVDVLASYAVSLGARAAYGLRLRRGEHRRRHDVLLRRASTVTVEGEPFYASADGEIEGPFTSRTWHVERGALRMVVGQDK